MDPSVESFATEADIEPAQQSRRRIVKIQSIYPMSLPRNKRTRFQSGDIAPLLERKGLDEYEGVGPIDGCTVSDSQLPKRRQKTVAHLWIRVGER